MTVHRRTKKKKRAIIGWREWVALPELGVDRIKAKIDTGARTSALHALQPETFQRKGEPYVRFRVHPVQKHRHPEILCEALLLDSREVKNSGGHIEHRFVIETPLQIGKRVFSVEITLTDRAPMGFRMLLGRTAVRRRFLVNPGSSFLLSE